VQAVFLNHRLDQGKLHHLVAVGLRVFAPKLTPAVTALLGMVIDYILAAFYRIQLALMSRVAFLSSSLLA
jgi:hypothetical protein